MVAEALVFRVFGYRNSSFLIFNERLKICLTPYQYKYTEIQDIKKITAESLYKAYLNALSTYPIEIYAVGEMNIDMIATKFKKCFENIQRNPIEIPEIEIKKEAKEVKRVVDTEKVNQARLVLGFRTGYDYKENRYHVVQLFNEILGSSPTSKLFLNVREKLSLCYSCRSMVNQKNGLLIIAAGIDAKNKEIALFGICSYRCFRLGWGSGDMMAQSISQINEGLKNAGYSLNKEVEESKENK